MNKMNLFLFIFTMAMILLCIFVFITYLNTINGHEAIITPYHTHNNITVHETI